MGFDLSSYEPVSARLDRWLTAKLAGYTASTNDYPRVLTRMVSEPGADICVIRAELWLGENLIATGYAEEIRDVSGRRTVNASSHVENCETSAIGRALANCGMAGADMTKRPSREEMSKVQRTSNGPVERGTDDRMPNVTVTQPAGLASEKQVYFAASFYKKAEREAPKAWLATLSKSEISALIDDLKAGKFPEADPNEEAPF